jgi:hypothetical protein
MKLYIHEPSSLMTAALETAKEIIEPTPDADPEADGKEGEEGEKEDSDFESEIDPDDPLYGLKERLAVLEFDDETKLMIKTKLKEQNEKMKRQLEDRQVNLDSKLSAVSGKK